MYQTIAASAYRGGTGTTPEPEPVPTFDPSYQAVLDYNTAQGIAQPDTTGQEVDNQLIVDLKAADLWTKTDCLLKYSGSAPTGYKKVDFKRLVQVTESGSLTWGANGVEGTGGYIDTGFIPSVHGVNYTLNNAGIFAVIDKNVSQNISPPKAIIGAYDGNTSGYVLITNNHTGTGNGNFYCINGLYNEPSNTILGIGGNGFYRTSASYISLRGSNGSKTITANSEPPLTDIPLYMLARNTQGTAGLFSDERVKYLWIGSSLTEAEHATLETILI